MMPYYLLKMIICLIVFTVCPFLLGENVVILTKFNINSKVIALLYRYVMGWVLELALFQVFAVPFILFKTHFTYLLIVWVLFLVVLMLSGVFFCFKNLKKNADILELKTSEQDRKNRTYSFDVHYGWSDRLSIISIWGKNAYRFR